MPKSSTTPVPASKRHILALGGAATPPSVVKFLLKLTGKKAPKVLIINTATGDSPEGLVKSYARFASLPCSVTHLTLFERTPVDLEALILRQDLIFVGGGNTKSMLAVWREYGIDKILAEAWKRGIVLSGSSAGGICWFEGCCTDSFAESYTALPAMGFLKGSCCPHYDGEAGRQETYRRLVSEGQLDDGLAVDEGVGLHFVGNSLKEVVTAKKGSGAYSVSLKKGKIVEKALPTRLVTL